MLDLAVPQRSRASNKRMSKFDKGFCYIDTSAVKSVKCIIKLTETESSNAWLHGLHVWNLAGSHEEILCTIQTNTLKHGLTIPAGQYVHKRSVGTC